LSRETDISSSGPQGRGGAAYPSGTQPYGERQHPSLHPAQDAAVDDGKAAAEAGGASGAEEPRTETTLTTRIKINIPGSRPIPPVVVRKPVEGADDAPKAPGATAPDGGAASIPAPAPVGREEPQMKSPDEGKKGETKTSDWFSPRKPLTPPASSAPAAADRQQQDRPYPSAGSDEGDAPAPHPFNAGNAGPDPVHGAAAPGDEAPDGGGGRGRAGSDSTPAFGTRIGSEPSGAAGQTSGDMFLPPEFHRGPGMAQDAQGNPARPPASASGEDPREAPHGRGAFGGGLAGPGRPSPFGPGLDGAGDAAGGGAPVRVSGDTLVSGIPRIPAFDDVSPAASGDADSRSAAVPGTSGPAPARKKGRSKAVLAGVGLVGLAAVAYGAGLLLDHAEVPNGTTVLGVDIGGTSKEVALRKLDAVLAPRSHGPLTVMVDGKQEQLKPSVAGLNIDIKASVRDAAGRDYNPVSVIGSLFGGSREVDPHIEVDEEKLTAALRTIDEDTGGREDGMIVFKAGKAVAVPGRTHQALDVHQSVAAVGKAYRERAETGRGRPVDLPVGMRKPAIDKAELDRAMKDFAEPAMSGLVTVQTDAAHRISFSPQNSLPKFLSMKAINGRLVDTYDLKTLKKLYGGTFDGVLIQRATGQKTEVTPQDVVVALRQALRGKTPTERVATIETNPQ
jgi:hypothetical protein